MCRDIIDREVEWPAADRATACDDGRARGAAKDGRPEFRRMSSADSTTFAPSRISRCTAAVPPARRRTGHDQDVAPLLERRGRGDERPALLWRLDHHDRAGQAADDAVAQWKVVRQRRHARRELADDRTGVVPCRRASIAVLRRVDAIDAAAEDADRCPARRERRGVRRGIDATRQP